MKVNWKNLETIARMNGLTMTKLSIDLGRNNCYFANMKNDEREPGPEIVAYLEKKLGVDAEMFMDEEHIFDEFEESQFEIDVRNSIEAINKKVDDVSKAVLCLVSMLRRVEELMDDLVYCEEDCDEEDDEEDEELLQEENKTDERRAVNLLYNMRMKSGGRVAFEEYRNRLETIGIKRESIMADAIEELDCTTYVTGYGKERKRWILSKADMENMYVR